MNKIPKDWEAAFVIPLFEGGDPTVLNNYRMISKLSVLSKVLETLVSDQVKEYLVSNSVLSPFLSGFGKHCSTTSAGI